MKGIVARSMVLVLLSFGLAITANAKSNHKANKDMHHKWMCETNASRASTDADKKADETMSTKAMSAKDAFKFAYKHCRDCTKITCTAEENNKADNNNNNHSSD